MPAGTPESGARKAKRGRRRIDWVATHRRIMGFLEREVSEIEVRRRARNLITSPREIAKHTGLSVNVVREYLSRFAGRKPDDRIFPVGGDRVGRIFHEVSKREGIRITPKILRGWQNCVPKTTRI